MGEVIEMKNKEAPQTLIYGAFVIMAEIGMRALAPTKAQRTLTNDNAI
jgi:hypothetical protein